MIRPRVDKVRARGCRIRIDHNLQCRNAVFHKKTPAWPQPRRRVRPPPRPPQATMPGAPVSRHSASARSQRRRSVLAHPTIRPNPRAQHDQAVRRPFRRSDQSPGRPGVFHLDAQIGPARCATVARFASPSAAHRRRPPRMRPRHTKCIAPPKRTESTPTAFSFPLSPYKPDLLQFAFPPLRADADHREYVHATQHAQRRQKAQSLRPQHRILAFRRP